VPQTEEAIGVWYPVFDPIDDTVIATSNGEDVVSLEPIENVEVVPVENDSEQPVIDEITQPETPSEVYLVDGGATEPIVYIVDNGEEEEPTYIIDAAGETEPEVVIQEVSGEEPIFIVDGVEADVVEIGGVEEAPIVYVV